LHMCQWEILHALYQLVYSSIISLSALYQQ
jgi:hypothetical protein